MIFYLGTSIGSIAPFLISIIVILVVFIVLYNNNTIVPKVEVTMDKIEDKLEDIKLPKIDLEFKEVFNIPENNYNYNEAKEICKAYNSKLATYDQIEEAYNDGADWCKYGWSAKQMALFPTQKKTWNDLQKIKGHKNDCGRPGINGGRMEKDMKFGVNCYGKKPQITQEEEQLMMTNTIYPKTEEDVELQKKTDFWKEKVEHLIVSPFNYSSWYKI
jgi:hypothetical protein